jgi:hypothetical protein
MAFKAPSGLMAMPSEPERCLEFPLEDGGERYGTLYVDREVWEGNPPGRDELIFYVQDYGRFRLKIER